MTLPSETLALTAELRDELARNEPRRKLIDPRGVPLRFHHLKAIGRSAAHCFESFQSDGDDSLAKRMGSGVHALLMGQPSAVFDMPAKRGKGRAPRTPGSEQWEEFRAKHAGSVILSRKENDEAIRIVTAIRNNPEAHQWLTAPGVSYERTIRWSQAGRDRQSTPDVRCPRRITEVKTTRSAAPGAFRWDVKRFCYHAQLVDQRNAARTQNRDPEELCIIAVEKTRPYVVQTYRLTPRDIELGERILGAWFNAFRVAEDSNAWGGYADGTIDLDVPDDDDDGEIVFGEPEEDDAEQVVDGIEVPF